MNQRRAFFTPAEKIGSAAFVLIGCVLVHFGFFHIKGREATDAMSTELSNSLAPQLGKNGVTSYKATANGLRFVANGRTICLLRGGADRRNDNQIVAFAEKAGCGLDSKVLLLDRMQPSMPRGYGLSFIFLEGDEAVGAERSKDGSWLSTVNLNWPSADKGRSIANDVAEDIEGVFSVINVAPSEARSPAELQKYLSR